MRRSLGTLALLPVLLPALLLPGLTACGDDGGHDSSSTASSPSPSASPSGARQVALLTATAAGGTVTPTPTPLPDEDAVREYAAQFRGEELGGRIVHAAEQADVPDGAQLAAAVVAVGCEVPKRVVSEGSGADATLTAVLPATSKQCLAPMTTVALVLLPA